MTDDEARPPLELLTEAVMVTSVMLHQVLQHMEASRATLPSLADLPPSEALLADLVLGVLEAHLGAYTDFELDLATDVLDAVATVIEEQIVLVPVEPPRPDARPPRRRGHCR